MVDAPALRAHPQAAVDTVLELLRKEREVAELQGRITSQVNEKVSEQQREFFLREQLKIIQKELGISKDDRTSDVEMFRGRMEQLHPPEAAAKRIEDELQKLSVLETGSPEYGVTRNYLDWATSVPWGVHSEDNLELKHARAVLEAFVPFEREISVVGVRGLDGSVALYEPVVNDHANHILDLTVAPADLPGAVVDRAREIMAAIGQPDFDAFDTGPRPDWAALMGMAPALFRSTGRAPIHHLSAATISTRSSMELHVIADAAVAIAGGERGSRGWCWWHRYRTRASGNRGRLRHHCP